MGHVTRAVRVTGRYGGFWVLGGATAMLGYASYTASPESTFLLVVVATFFAIAPLGIGLVVLAAIQDRSGPSPGGADRPYEFGPADVER